jgi:CDGSH-type Zn-finger protein
MKKGKIIISKNGPYLVSGNLPLSKEISTVGKEGEPEEWVKGKEYPRQKSYALCRCGNSKNKPFCDGSHIASGFDGTETASRESYEDQSEIIEGTGVNLKDADSFCSAGRFCHAEGGTWNLILESDDPKKKQSAIHQACNCPSGRLVAYDKKTGKPIECEYTPSISLIEDPQARCSGPIWVKGCVPIESEDGTPYETRNRVTLCRCGKSSNKPFCDGNHIKARFNDGDESLKK